MIAKNGEKTKEGGRTKQGGRTKKRGRTGGTTGAKPAEPALVEVISEKAHELEKIAEEKLVAARQQFQQPVGARPPWLGPWFILGATLLATAALGLGLLWTMDRAQAWAVSVAIGLMFAAGKESSLPYVLFALDGDPVLVGTWLVWVDVGASVMIYPFIAAAIAGVEKQRGPVWGFVGGVVRSTHRKAARKRKLLDKYGGVGLWVFSIVPFAFNGPPVGMTLGRIVGLRTRSIIAAIVCAIVATTAVWTVAWATLIEKGVSELPVPEWIFAATAIAIMLVAVSFTFVEGRRERQRERLQAKE